MRNSHLIVVDAFDQKVGSRNPVNYVHQLAPITMFLILDSVIAIAETYYDMTNSITVLIK